MKTLAALAFAAVLGAASPVLAASPAEAEATLRSTISEIQSGAPNYDAMVPALADAVKGHPEAVSQLAALGPVTAVAATSQADPYTYDVTFQNGAVLHWTLSINAEGKIAGLSVQGD
jgi:inosine-uridine nucleoside N-ribohydrolase